PRSAMGAPSDPSSRTRRGPTPPARPGGPRGAGGFSMRPSFHDDDAVHPLTLLESARVRKPEVAIDARFVEGDGEVVRRLGERAVDPVAGRVLRGYRVRWSADVLEPD